MPVTEAEDIADISSRISALSKTRAARGEAQAADELTVLAAKLELLSDELQTCWGGALNGQEGRRSIFKEVLKAIDCKAVYETGTFRGVTTAWFAEHFSGTVFSCEAEKLYFLQAKANLERHANIELTYGDSREFLRKKLGPADEHGHYFIYLDAHWKEDLPLAEEVGIIFQSGRKCVIAIDDFKVPGDSYAYDDYGPEKVISLDLLRAVRDSGFKFYFPKLRAEQETGASRGVCILTNSLIAELDSCQALQGGSWDEWKAVEIDHDIKTAPVRNEEDDMESAAHDTEAATTSTTDNISNAVESNMLNDEKFEQITSLMNAKEISDKQRFAGIESQIQALDISAISSRIDGLQSALAELNASFSVKLDEIDGARELGRKLVEQRACSLELERRNHMLTDQLFNREKQMAGVKVNPQASELNQRISEIKAIVDGLTKSRAIGLLQVLAPGPKRDIARIAAQLNALVAECGIN